MRTGIATVCLSGALPDKLRAAAAAGFDGVEIFEADLVSSPLSPTDVRLLAADLGLALDLYQPFRDFDSVPDESFRANLRRAAAKFELMGQLGIDTILVCSTVATSGGSYLDDDSLRAEQLHALAELASEHGVKVAYEALAWGSFVNDYRHAWRIVESADHPNLGTCLDTFHILSRGHDPAGIEQIDPAKIFFVQVADAPALSMDVLSWSRHHRVFPGEGQFDLPNFMGHLVRSGYAGTVSLEVFNDTFRQSDVTRTAVDGLRSLIWLEDRTLRHLAAAEPAAEPRMSLSALPPVAPPTGFNFAEITAADTTELERLLGQLGFTAQGRHRTKPVQLWILGDARVVLNSQCADGVSPNLSALAFDVAAPMISAARAHRLKAPEVPRSSQSGEEVLQVVLAPDGTEVFLCNGAAWADEFSPALRQAQGTEGARIDHLNLAQPWQHYDEAVLFFSSVLALSPQPSQDVAGPSGLIRSQVVHTEQTSTGDRAVRLALNLAPWVQTDSVQGSYPEHLAIAVTDLIGVARSCRARGLEFLAIPANYYADLAARFDLDHDLLATLQELDLLYDRDDAGGEFLHFYTATIGSVFIEIVERLGGYDGYGAANAPVRLAAQHRSSPIHPSREQEN